MTDPYEGLNATARRREQEEDLGELEYEMLHNRLEDEIEAGMHHRMSKQEMHTEVTRRMKAAKDAAQD